MTIHISEEDVIAKLPMAKAIDLVEEAFRQLAAGTAVNHPRQRVILPTGSILHYMAAGNPEYFGIKVYSSNPKTGAHFQFLLYRSTDGAPLATIEANRLGQIRTGAASAVATKYLARPDARTLGIIGSGFQAETQLAALVAARKFSEVRVWSRDEQRRTAFALRSSEQFGLRVVPAATAREAVEDAGIVVTATNSREPVLESGWIAAGTHVNAMGSNWANRRELPAELVVRRASVVAVDSVEDAKIESGDLILAQRDAGLESLPAVDLGEIMAGRLPGRTNPDEVTIFKSNGLAIQDVVTAGFVYESIAK